MRWISNLIPTLVYTVPAVLIAISLHELAHGWASWKLGDPTPRATGRLSLNPLRHLDPIGTLCLLVFHFGWAKPVMVDPRYYKNRKRGMVLTALAGPGMNFLISLVCTLGMGLILRLTGGYVGAVVRYIYYLLFYTSAISTGLGLFNLIPVPPLDGSKVLGAVLPEDKYFGYMRYERYGALIMMVLLFTGVLDRPLAFLSDGLSDFFWLITEAVFRLGKASPAFSHRAAARRVGGHRPKGGS